MSFDYDGSVHTRPHALICTIRSNGLLFTAGYLPAILIRAIGHHAVGPRREGPGMTSMIVSCVMVAALRDAIGGLEHRPQFHLISQGAYTGWLSDPNGPVYANGRYHVFYQAATTAQMRAKPAPYHTPDPISWGHMSSSDLTHWVQHPMAINPAPPGSFEGDDVYSGAIIQDPVDGAVISFFACAVVGAKPPGRSNDAVCYARSTDANITTFTGRTDLWCSTCRR